MLHNAAGELLHFIVLRSEHNLMTTKRIVPGYTLVSKTIACASSAACTPNRQQQGHVHCHQFTWPCSHTKSMLSGMGSTGICKVVHYLHDVANLKIIVSTKSGRDSCDFRSRIERPLWRTASLHFTKTSCVWCCLQLPTRSWRRKTLTRTRTCAR
jgi:hypothetical protein